MTNVKTLTTGLLKADKIWNALSDDDWLLISANPSGYLSVREVCAFLVLK